MLPWKKNIATCVTTPQDLLLLLGRDLRWRENRSLRGLSAINVVQALNKLGATFTFGY